MSPPRAESRPYFTTDNGYQLRRLPRALPCPNCDAVKISIELQLDEEPYSFKAWGECQHCGTKGPATTRVVGLHGHSFSVEYEAAGLWNEISEECMAGIQTREMPASAKRAFERMWRRISKASTA